MGQVQVPDPNHDCTAWLASSPPACIPPAYPWPSAITSCWSKIEPSLETGRGFCVFVATPERSDAGGERARHGHFGIMTRMGLCAQSLQVPVEDSSFKGKRKKGRSTAEIKKGQIDTLAPNATRPFLPIPDHDPARAFFPPPPDQRVARRAPKGRDTTETTCHSPQRPPPPLCSGHGSCLGRLVGHHRHSIIPETRELWSARATTDRTELTCCPSLSMRP